MSHPPQDHWDEHDVRGPAAEHDDVLGFRSSGEHDESLADEMLDPAAPGGAYPPRRARRRNPVLKVVALLLAVGIVAVAAVYSFGALRQLVPDLPFAGSSGQAASDYEGQGSGEVMVEIPPGAAGGQIGEILVQHDVVASTTAFTSALAADTRSGAIQPGTYRMAEQMSAQAALSRLLDGGFREIDGVTIREGLWVSETFALLAEATGHEVSEYEAVDPATLELPAAADGQLEGFLYPSTYEFPQDATPQQQLQTLVDQGTQVYARLGIPDEQLREVVIKASIVQGEGMFAQDLPKIARVMENRVGDTSETFGMMQMDSTVHFIYQERGRAGTTPEQRDNPDPYNTYQHPGLPPGPINSPGEAALNAVLNPAAGDWLYFVTVNPDTGETVFTNTLADHERAMQEWLQWCAENQDRC